MENVNVSLKQYSGKSVVGILTHASEAEISALKADYKGIDLYIDAKGVKSSNLIDFANTGNLGKISIQGIISNIYIHTNDGWVCINKGRAIKVK